MLASQVLCDVAEVRRDELSQAQRYAVTASQRATQTWNNADLYLDLDAYGSKPSAVLTKARMARVHELEAAQQHDFQPSEPDYRLVAE